MNSALLRLGLGLLAAFNLWLVAFTIRLDLTPALPWWIVALAGAFGGLALLVVREKAWPLALAVALGTSAVMRAYFAFDAFRLNYSGLLAVALAVCLGVAAASAVGRRRALRSALVAFTGVVALLAMRHFWLGQWPALWRQILHLVAFVVLSAAVAQGQVDGSVDPHPATG